MQWTGRHTVRGAALFRLVELVVHGRDLPAPVPPDDGALGLVVRSLASALPPQVGLRVPPWLDGDDVVLDGLTLVELCAGRRAWADAPVDVRGDVGALEAALPLLG